MRWQQLVSEGRLRAKAADRDEIRTLCASVRRQLANAQIAGLTPDGRLQHAFSAVRQAATIALRAEGYQTRGRGHHETTFEALHAIGAPLSRHVGHCQDLRSKRIDIEYSGDDVSSQEALDALRCAESMVRDVKAWLAMRHPDLPKR